ncbi:hypothetical protein ES703_56353 [subsurface metagenome]
MKRVLKGENSTGEDCVLEITGAGKSGLVWLNTDYFNNPHKPYIVVDAVGLISLVKDINDSN